jgi:hypothetical protein
VEVPASVSGGMGPPDVVESRDDIGVAMIENSDLMYSQFGVLQEDRRWCVSKVEVDLGTAKVEVKAGSLRGLSE